jgi:DNA-binding SARP family transcriptional activator/predicted ATPase
MIKLSFNHFRDIRPSRGLVNYLGREEVIMTESLLQISLFGEFGLVYRGRPVSTFHGDRPLSLLAYLLLHRHTAVSRQHLAFTLWPDSCDSQARTNLRNLLYTLRNSLPDADNYLAADAMTLKWREDTGLVLDVAEFEAALAAVKTADSPQEKIAKFQTAITFYKGDLLQGNYEDWIIPLREELRQAYLDALHQLARLLEDAGEYRAAARISRRLIQYDPLDEPAYIHLMRLHALSGDRAGVRRAYEACALALRGDLDVEPAPATQAAYKDLLQLDMPVLAAEPLPAVGQIRPAPLPVPGTFFIGREVELAQIAELLADPACRLLTIVGPGGIGKTRLALQTGTSHKPVFKFGAAWVALNTVQSPEHLAAAVAESLNYRLRGAGSAETELISLLVDKELLLVLDNFEHLLPAANFLTRLLGETSAVKILVTSRQALELPQEWRFDLGVFPLPDEDSSDALEENSAVQLFVQSGRRADSTFTPTEADYLAIAHICELVGGMPLGIELAASWLRVLSCTEIAAEVEKSLDFLTVTMRHLPPRHRSLRAIFDYSWALLTNEEQQILLRLSIFQGGFSRQAAEQVAMTELPQLSALVDRTLVQRTTVGRYVLHNTIRQYAAEQLQADPAAHGETAQRHSSYYLQWLAEQEKNLFGSGQKEALTAVSAKIANVRTAWKWAAAHQQSGLLRRAAFPLFYFYDVRGLLSEGEAAFKIAAVSLQSENGAATSDTRRAICALNIYQAYLGFRQGKVASAEALLRSTFTELQMLEDETLLGHALCYLGILEWSLGRFDNAIADLQRFMTLASRQSDEWGAATAQVYLGLVRHDQGQLSEARRLLTAVQPIAKKLGDPRLLANALLISGRINLLLGYLDEAERELSACLEMTNETRDPNSITYATLYLGMVKQVQGDLTAARELIEQSMTLYAGFNDLVGLERAWVTMGFLELDAGNLEAAQYHFLAFLNVKQRTHSVRYILGAVVGSAVVQARLGNLTTALLWTLAVLQHPGVDWEVRQRADKLCLELQNKMPPEQITSTTQQLASHSFETILAAASAAEHHPSLRVW